MRARAARLGTRYRDRAERWGKTPDRTITARLLLIHTLAHALIDQFALDAGYPAASLRERLYEWVARNRLHWFGRREVCYVASAAERERFL